MAAQDIEIPIVYEGAKGKFLPQHLTEGVEVIDFWFAVYDGDSGVAQKFSQGVLEKLVSSGHAVELRDVAFATAVLQGKARVLYVVRRGVARATLNVSLLGDKNHIYVSLRLLFQGAISQWRTLVLFSLAVLLAIPPALIGFWPVWIMLGSTKEEYVRGLGTQTVPDWNNALLAFLIASGILALLNNAARQVWSLWRYGDSRALKREDLDELYRDDLAALGTEIILAATATADELDLEQLRVAGETLPTFAANAQTNRTKRKPRM